MENYLSSSPSITNTTFTGNSATNNGGGMYNDDSSSPSITNTTFTGNSATNRGGGMHNSSPTITITNTTFTGNSANYGGGMYNRSSSPSITNTIFTGNSATFGGGVFNEASSPSITNTTFTGNSASNSGGGMFNLFSSSNPMIRNSIVWGNGTEISNDASTPVVSYSIVQGGYTGCSNCPGTNGNADPLFVNAADPDGADNIHRTADDGLRLQSRQPRHQRRRPCYYHPCNGYNRRYSWCSPVRFGRL
jgi:parallel beta-helix repeat protein